MKVEEYTMEKPKTSQIDLTGCLNYEQFENLGYLAEIAWFVPSLFPLCAHMYSCGSMWRTHVYKCTHVYNTKATIVRISVAIDKDRPV